MSFPQGIYFRATDNQVDPSNFDAEIGNTENYPRTSAQGNSVGWEVINASIGRADRDTITDVRLKGIHQHANTTVGDYRIDLPNTGTYKVGCAIGDGGGSQTNMTAVLVDGETSFKTIVSDVNISSGRWYDAAGNLHIGEAAFGTGEEMVTHTFSSTVLRLRIGGNGQSGNTTVAFLYVEAADVGGSGRVVFRGS
jgi:hypothetical protein